jgi:hypothetical protein
MADRGGLGCRRAAARHHRERKAYDAVQYLRPRLPGDVLPTTVAHEHAPESTRAGLHCRVCGADLGQRA